MLRPKQQQHPPVVVSLLILLRPDLGVIERGSARETEIEIVTETTAVATAIETENDADPGLLATVHEDMRRTPTPPVEIIGRGSVRTDMLAETDVMIEVGTEIVAQEVVVTEMMRGAHAEEIVEICLTTGAEEVEVEAEAETKMRWLATGRRALRRRRRSVSPLQT
jgi:hypothetical protein